ncbi:hypothetical protein EYF80_002926 [Liparis tanakae]|uniref:Uncharacterized protein n=1 Tax=Liparis tanakae TaxID=230148 RepID=A0A4Z2JAI1_9TELE|nr:hypothetical protein EYF80_002926 [Liparis tanakae]
MLQFLRDRVAYLSPDCIQKTSEQRKTANSVPFPKQSFLRPLSVHLEAGCFHQNQNSILMQSPTSGPALCPRGVLGACCQQDIGFEVLPNVIPSLTPCTNWKTLVFPQGFVSSYWVDLGHCRGFGLSQILK